MQGQGRDGENDDAKRVPDLRGPSELRLRGFPLAHSLTEPKPELNETHPPRRPVHLIPGLRPGRSAISTQATTLPALRTTKLDSSRSTCPTSRSSRRSTMAAVQLVRSRRNQQPRTRRHFRRPRTMSMPMAEVFNTTRYDRSSDATASSAARRGRTSPAISTPESARPWTARTSDRGDDGEVPARKRGGAVFLQSRRRSRKRRAQGQCRDVLAEPRHPFGRGLRLAAHRRR